jgi:hypothetical protein
VGLLTHYGETFHKGFGCQLMLLLPLLFMLSTSPRDSLSRSKPHIPIVHFLFPLTFSGTIEPIHGQSQSVGKSLLPANCINARPHIVRWRFHMMTKSRAHPALSYTRTRRAET